MVAVEQKEKFLGRAQFPEKVSFLWNPCRYKVLRGGRGSAKSWSVARILLIKGQMRPLRVLCAREVQLSIKQSVHRLLKDQISLLGLESHYQPLETEIRGRNGTEFSFTGLSQLTVDTIKSFEGVDICWVEEGQVISKRSWDILIPTIRKTGSEIWIVYNPDLDTDETHQRFTIDPPPNCTTVEVNWRDNPWFNEVLEAERRHCQISNPDDYDNIWEGKCRSAAEGAIYQKQMTEVEIQGRICHVPYDPMLKVHLVYDLGWGDSLGVALVQVKTSEIRVIEYLEASRTSHDTMSAELRRRQYNWGKVWLPHDGYAGSLKSKGKSDYDLLRALGWDVARRDEITEMSVEQGIRHARMVFPRMYFDQAKCNAPKQVLDGFVDGYNATPLNHRLVEALRRYQRNVSKATHIAGGPLHDEHSHGADVVRYIAANANKITNEGVGPGRAPGRSVSQIMDGIQMGGF